MKYIALLLLLITAATSDVAAQNGPPYKVVFDLTNPDTAMHQRVIRWMKMILQEHPDAALELVLYGQSIDMATNGKSSVQQDLQKLSQNKQVKVAVCEQTMKRHQLSKDQLVPGISTVPDGIYEIITKQSQGYGYIKVTQ